MQINMHHKTGETYTIHIYFNAYMLSRLNKDYEEWKKILKQDFKFAYNKLLKIMPRNEICDAKAFMYRKRKKERRKITRCFV